MKKKRELKAMAKANKNPPLPCDGDIRPDGFEFVKRDIHGVPVEGWVPEGRRELFIETERRRIKQEYARNPDSSDSADSLSAGYFTELD